MSIIHDALKKIQDKRTPEPPSSSKIKETPVPPGIATNNTNKTSRFLIPGIGALIAAGILSFILLSPNASHIPKKTSAIDNSMSLETPTPIQTIIPPAQKKAPPATPASGNAFRIEGVMDMGNGKKVILVNGKIYEAGQLLDGKLLEEITLDNIILIDNGMRKTIPIEP